MASAILRCWHRGSNLAPTIDANWLNLALIIGIPGTLMVATMFIGSCAVNTARLSEKNSLRARIGLALGICIGMYIFVGFTVYFWGTASIVGVLFAGMRSAIGSIALMDTAQPGQDGLSGKAI